MNKKLGGKKLIKEMTPIVKGGYRDMGKREIVEKNVRTANRRGHFIGVLRNVDIESLRQAIELNTQDSEWKLVR